MSEAAVPSGSGPGGGLARVLPDDRLARRAARGDERAFAAIFRRYHQSIYRYCLGILGDPQDAQDALQNTMVKVLRALPGEERQIALKPWLYRIAHNESIELVRRRRETRQLDPELSDPGPGLAEDSAARERLAQLISDLRELPERQRGALVMRELSGLDFAEIAAVLGTSPAVARQTLYEARLSLRQMDEGREMSCETVTRALSDGDGRVTRRRDVRAHLRTCAGCRGFGEEIEGRERDLAALSPLPVAAAAGLLHGALGGSGGSGGGLASALGGGAAKTVAASAAIKGAATVAVVAALATAAADRGGLIHLGIPGGGGSQATQSQSPSAAGDGVGQSTQAAGLPAAGSAAAAGEGQGKAGRARNAAAGSASSRRANAEATPGQDGQASSTSHANGRGHAKEHPAASAHGQQTAATHKAAVKHGSAAGSHPVHPAKPSHPPKPAPPKTPTVPPSHGAEPEPDSQSAAPPATDTEEASSGREGGKRQ